MAVRIAPGSLCALVGSLSGVLTELKNCRAQGILIACVDGLKGFTDAIAVEYSHTRIQLCLKTPHLHLLILRRLALNRWHAIVLDPFIQTVRRHAQAAGNLCHRITPVSDLLDCFNPEFFHLAHRTNAHQPSNPLIEVAIRN